MGRTFARVVPAIPDHIVKVAASAVRGPRDPIAHADHGADAVLVGDPQAVVADLVAAGIHH